MRVQTLLFVRVQTLLFVRVHVFVKTNRNVYRRLTYQNILKFEGKNIVPPRRTFSHVFLVEEITYQKPKFSLVHL